MTVLINGTTGISGTNGSAGTPAVQGEDTNTGIFFPAADTVAVATAGSERLRVNSSGNAGLGVTPAAWSGTARALQVGNAGIEGRTDNASYNTLSANAYTDSGTWKYISSDWASRYTQFQGVHYWLTAPSGTAGNAISFTQAMTLDANGSFLLGVTSAQNGNNSDLPGITLYGSTGDAKGAATFVRQSPSSVMVVNNRTAGGGLVAFLNGSNVVGTITSNGSTTAYNTTSDYRLKENVAPMQNALDTVAQLNPVTYTWKADGSAGQGFIAHELQAVVPDCVTGQKDAVDAEGNPQYQGVDTSFLVATLCKAIQELTARVAQLEAQ